MDEQFTYNRRAPKLIKQAVNACTSVPPESRESRESKENSRVVSDVTPSSVVAHHAGHNEAQRSTTKHNEAQRSTTGHNGALTGRQKDGNHDDAGFTTGSDDFPKVKFMFETEVQGAVMKPWDFVVQMISKFTQPNKSEQWQSDDVRNQGRCEQQPHPSVVQFVPTQQIQFHLEVPVFADGLARDKFERRTGQGGVEQVQHHHDTGNEFIHVVDLSPVSLSFFFLVFEFSNNSFFLIFTFPV
jgi:hypothetical protein